MDEINSPNENWIDTKWRPMMGWVYMATCIFDFIIAPILWPILLVFAKLPITAWQPLTLSNAGLYHVAMGAIVSMTSFNRTKEKMAQFSGSPPPTST